MSSLSSNRQLPLLYLLANIMDLSPLFMAYDCNDYSYVKVTIQIVTYIYFWWRGEESKIFVSVCDTLSNVNNTHSVHSYYCSKIE